MRLALTVLALCVAQTSGPDPRLLHPDAPDFSAPAPPRSLVTLETTKGDIVIELVRDWAPRGADRFYHLARLGYYTDMRVHRIRAATWAQFGINGTPAIAQAWRHATIRDDPFQPAHPNVRGTVAFAFKDPNGRTTQVFINLRDNRETHDREPFVPIGQVVTGMDAADRLFTEYGEAAGGGIRAGRQDPAFEGGNAWFDQLFPKLDKIIAVRVRGGN